MATEFNFSSNGIIEYEVLDPARRDRLVNIVLQAVLGNVLIDYEMVCEWVQGRTTIVDYDQLERYYNGAEGVGLRDVKTKAEIKPPSGIVRLRRKAYRRVERALQELYNFNIVTSYTLRPNGYIRVNWFKGYVHVERVQYQVTVEYERGYPDMTSEQMKADYLRDCVSYACNNYLRDLPDWRSKVIHVKE